MLSIVAALAVATSAASISSRSRDARRSASASAAAADPRSVGVCWTRNQVAQNQNLDDWKELFVSAASLRLSAPGDVGTCLFTEVDKSAVDDAMAACDAALGGYVGNAPLFDVVLRASTAEDALEDVRRAAPLDRVIRSRLGRLHHLLRSPFASTLFIDDDTAFCGGGNGESLLGALEAFRDAAPDVRFASKHASAALTKRKIAAASVYRAAALQCAAARCPRDCPAYGEASYASPAWYRDACGRCRVRCGDDLVADVLREEANATVADPGCVAFAGSSVNLQGGAVFVKSTVGGAAFVRDWITAYADYWLAPNATEGHGPRYVGMDQRGPPASVSSLETHTPRPVGRRWRSSSFPTAAVGARGGAGATRPRPARRAGRTRGATASCPRSSTRASPSARGARWAAAPSCSTATASPRCPATPTRPARGGPTSSASARP